MGKHLEHELADLKHKLLNMGTLVETLIIGSIEALSEQSAEKARRVIKNDTVIDELENNIDEICLDLLALQQPLAKDLRFVSMSMKIDTDLERMADLAVDISQRVIEISDKPLLKPLVDIPKLGSLAQVMTKDALTSFIQDDIDLAMKVILLDSEADRLRDSIQKEFIEKYILKDFSTATRAVPLILIARHLERICDHATNMAEDVVYLVQAKIIRHHPRA
jgi:phosphate transport system protein